MSLRMAAPMCAQAPPRSLSLSSPLSFTLPSHLSLRHSLKYPLQSFSISPSPPTSFSLSSDEFEERVIGDCVVFEEGAFEDPCVFDDVKARNSNHVKPKPKKDFPEIEPENLVPDKWREAQAEINITKKERRKIAQELEFGTRVEKKRKGLLPLRQVNFEEYSAFREAKLAQLKPLLLDNPARFPAQKKVETEELNESRDNGSSSQRVTPQNPRWAVYGKNLDDVSEFFNSGNYVPSDQKSEGRRKLFTKEENAMVNRRVPELVAATSDSWLPLHTLAASGEIFFVGALLKHNVDINAVDRIGLTALHKAILGKKQAITSYLLRESANPFVLDKDGATLLHYAVQTASSQGIKLLLLYDVDINIQDNNGWTPLHLAVQARRTDIVKLLLIKGADKTLKNGEGLTALELCLRSGRDTRTYELIKILKQFPKSKTKQESEY